MTDNRELSHLSPEEIEDINKEISQTILYGRRLTELSNWELMREVVRAQRDIDEMEKEIHGAVFNGRRLTDISKKELMEEVIRLTYFIMEEGARHEREIDSLAG